jgi:protein-S-isoprenylcysteine O-methyltransferase Ste14
MVDDATSTGAPNEDHPAVTLHPPTMLLLALIVGYVIRLFVGGRLPLPRAFAEGLGGLFVIVGLALVLMSVRAFNESGETLAPASPSRQLLRAGPYRFSRNPIYLGLMLFGVGFGLATSNIWIILATAVVGLLLHFFVILREEDYLERQFGDSYREYKAQVRRWI